MIKHFTHVPSTNFNICLIWDLLFTLEAEQEMEKILLWNF